MVTQMPLDKLCELLFAESSQVESVTLSAFEIRGTQAFDLLSEPALAPVKIMAASDDGIAGLSIHTTASAAETLALVHKAGALRTTRSTLKNDTSSRFAHLLSIEPVPRIHIWQVPFGHALLCDLQERRRALAAVYP
jgi:hypothetical protein